MSRTRSENFILPIPKRPLSGISTEREDCRVCIARNHGVEQVEVLRLTKILTQDRS
ncbi:Hypothetical protein FKW44_009908 [Caligus rogercresseyi]|uniref:Uncharacterized protein n=1 Tax=Caligus rogercresseyi TaxID=217165 RepID=A0A7T8HFV8_CALRO|nr:Hypothetical protein FKW44_009908 [Caligus rogercresseyi]